MVQLHGIRSFHAQFHLFSQCFYIRIMSTKASNDNLPESYRNFTLIWIPISFHFWRVVIHLLRCIDESIINSVSKKILRYGDQYSFFLLFVQCVYCITFSLIGKQITRMVWIINRSISENERGNAHTVQCFVVSFIFTHIFYLQ